MKACGSAAAFAAGASALFLPDRARSRRSDLVQMRADWKRVSKVAWARTTSCGCSRHDRLQPNGRARIGREAARRLDTDVLVVLMKAHEDGVNHSDAFETLILADDGQDRGRNGPSSMPVPALIRPRSRKTINQGKHGVSERTGTPTSKHRAGDTTAATYTASHNHSTSTHAALSSSHMTEKNHQKKSRNVNRKRRKPRSFGSVFVRGNSASLQFMQHRTLNHIPKADETLDLFQWLTSLHYGARRQERFSTDEMIAVLECVARFVRKDAVNFDIMKTFDKDTGFLASWDSLMTNHVCELAREQLASVMYYFGLLSKKPSDLFLDRWYAAAGDLDSFSPKEMTMALWAHVKMDHAPPESFLEHWKHRFLVLKRDFNSQALTNGLWSFAMLGIDAGMPFYEAWDECFMVQWATFSQHQIASFLWSFGLLGQLPSEACLRKIYAASTFMAPSFTSQSLSRIVEAHALLSAEAPNSFMEMWYSAFAGVSRVFTAEELDTCLSSLASLQLEPPSEFWELWIARFSDVVLTSVTGSTLSSVISSFAELGQRPDPYLLALWDACFQKCYADMTVSEISLVLESLIQLDIQPSSHFLYSWFNAFDVFLLPNSENQFEAPQLCRSVILLESKPVPELCLFKFVGAFCRLIDLFDASQLLAVLHFLVDQNVTFSDTLEKEWTRAFVQCADDSTLSVASAMRLFEALASRDFFPTPALSQRILRSMFRSDAGCSEHKSIEKAAEARQWLHFWRACAHLGFMPEDSDVHHSAFHDAISLSCRNYALLSPSEASAFLTDLERLSLDPTEELKLELQLLLGHHWEQMTAASLFSAVRATVGLGVTVPARIVNMWQVRSSHATGQARDSKLYKKLIKWAGRAQ
ncbi:Tbc2 translation factor, chloroplastic [Porphyridium purpureum]|uniref:Tbc2 translation factor, chloroplastic n=1 Tax=Porphyridium purpureum TaxID=35688 RepID=A0A5J4Z120_PORPP|nr:Tbc2 translation factor, chloroplastic [Porphyridium purpureum]|eukprot:POR7980..scf208_2